MSYAIWNKATQYFTGEYVISQVDGSPYQALTDSINQEPSVSPGAWVVVSTTAAITSIDTADGSGLVATNPAVPPGPATIDSTGLVAGGGIIITRSAVPGDKTLTISATGSLAPFTSQIFVNGVDGNDITGNGAPESPFATIGRALTARSTIPSTVRVAIMVGPGTYVCPTITLNRTYLIGCGSGDTPLATTLTGSLSALLSADGLATIEFAASGFNIVGASAPSAGAVFFIPGDNVPCIFTLTDCYVAGPVNALRIGNNTIQDMTVSIENCSFTSLAPLTSGSLITLVDAATVAGGVSIIFKGCDFVLSQIGSVDLVQMVNGSMRVFFVDCSMSSSVASGTYQPGAIIEMTPQTGQRQELYLYNSQCFYTADTADTATNKCIVQFFGGVGSVMYVRANGNYFNCVGASANTCFKKSGGGLADVELGGNYARSPASIVGAGISQTFTTALVA